METCRLQPCVERSEARARGWWESERSTQHYTRVYHNIIHFNLFDDVGDGSDLQNLPRGGLAPGQQCASVAPLAMDFAPSSHCLYGRSAALVILLEGSDLLYPGHLEGGFFLQPVLH